jgi:DNA-directed RNA polymerase specialized sigma24 family protein
MLEKLSKKDKQWRQAAFNICKCKDLADEIVNRTYMRLYDYAVEEEKLTDSYVIACIYNTYILYCKEPKHISIENFYDISEETTDSTFTDEEINILFKTETDLKWWQRELLIHSYDKSLREIETKFNINYKFVYDESNRVRKIILGEDYKRIRMESHSNTAKGNKDKRTKEYRNNN